MSSVLKCDLCNFTATSQLIYQTHMKYDHNKTELFQTSGRKRTRQPSHSSSSFQCNLCEFNPSTEGLLEIHQKYRHGIIEPKKIKLSQKSSSIVSTTSKSSSTTPSTTDSISSTSLITSANDSKKKQGDEKFWCLGCDKWLSRSKIAVTNHLQRHHGHEDDCQIIMINKQGMSKFDKQDFLTNPRKRQRGAN